jgi:hypothetical protein
VAFSGLLSKHGATLLFVARNPDSRLRDIADFVGVTERAAHTLVSDLCVGGYLERRRIGVRNHYELRGETVLPDPGLDGRRVAEVLGLLGVTPSATKPQPLPRGRWQPEPHLPERRQPDESQRERS